MYDFEVFSSQHFSALAFYTEHKYSAITKAYAPVCTDTQEVAGTCMILSLDDVHLWSGCVPLSLVVSGFVRFWTGYNQTRGLKIWGRNKMGDSFLNEFFKVLLKSIYAHQKSRVNETASHNENICSLNCLKKVVTTLENEPQPNQFITILARMLTPTSDKIVTYVKIWHLYLHSHWYQHLNSYHRIILYFSSKWLKYIITANMLLQPSWPCISFGFDKTTPQTPIPHPTTRLLPWYAQIKNSKYI